MFLVFVLQGCAATHPSYIHSFCNARSYGAVSSNFMILTSVRPSHIHLRSESLHVIVLILTYSVWTHGTCKSNNYCSFTSFAMCNIVLVNNCAFTFSNYNTIKIKLQSKVRHVYLLFGFRSVALDCFSCHHCF